jgi:hypothetical protein
MARRVFDLELVIKLIHAQPAKPGFKMKWVRLDFEFRAPLRGGISRQPDLQCFFHDNAKRLPAGCRPPPQLLEQRIIDA